MISSRISSKGQITLPKRVRQALNVSSGERVVFVLEGRSVVLRAMGPSSARDLAGSLRRYAKAPQSPQKIRDYVQKEVARAAAQEG
jgi:antitoxin PrlF